MLEKAREGYTFNNVWSQDGKIMFFDKNTWLKLIIVNFFFGNEPDHLLRKKSFVSIVILLRSFLLVLGIFYILTYYFYQILVNAPLIVKIHYKNTLLLSTITNQYFFSYNFYYYSITALSTNIKHINKISYYTIDSITELSANIKHINKYHITLLYRNISDNDQ